jgi:hypothetical protein
MKSGLFFLVVALTSISSALATPIIYDNIAPNGGLLYNSADTQASQFPSTFHFDAGMADDFRMAPSPGIGGDWLVTEIDWYGRFITGLPVSADSFNIIFWPDDGGSPAGSNDAGTGPKYSAALAIYSDVPTASSPSGGGSSNFGYYAALPAPFLAHANTSYWIEIQANVDYPPLWAPELTINTSIANPNYGFDLFGTPFWTKSLAGHDMAFTLHGTPSPEPTSALLMLPAALLLRRR